jgi:hydroxymethylpyrimidine/phosphomethylpyrimidine kinase
MKSERIEPVEKLPTLLSIAGYDPSGGAGLLLDLAVFRWLGYHGAGIMTALTFQNTLRVGGVRATSREDLRAQYLALRRDLTWKGLKVGMIGSRENLGFVARVLAANRGRPRVVDPVMRATSGAWLLEKDARAEFLSSVRGRATVLTPNLREASHLARLRVRSGEDMRAAARRIFEESAVPCLIKGGHLDGPPHDLLYDGRRFREYRHPRLKDDVHGTGCFLSAALLVFLADGYPLHRACGLGIGLTLRAIRGSRRPGRGRRVIGFPL